MYPIGIGKSRVASILPHRLAFPIRLVVASVTTAISLPDGVTVARVTLTHLVEVRILVGQLIEFACFRIGQQTPEETGVCSLVGFCDCEAFPPSADVCCVGMRVVLAACSKSESRTCR